jgi:hypothetical protein
MSLLTITSNIRLSSKCLPLTKHSSLFDSLISYEDKTCDNTVPVVNAMTFLKSLIGPIVE